MTAQSDKDSSRRFKDRRDAPLSDLIPRFASCSSSIHFRDATAIIQRLRDDGREFWQDGSGELKRWHDGWTDLLEFFNSLDRRRHIEKQPMETAMRDFIEKFEHTVYRVEQLLHGVKGRSQNNPSEIDAVEDWIGLAYRLSTYAITAAWIDDMTEEGDAISVTVNWRTGESSMETCPGKPMAIPRKRRASARLGRRRQRRDK